MKKIYVTTLLEVGSLGGAILWCKNRGLEPRSLSDAVALFLSNNCPFDESEAILEIVKIKKDAIEKMQEKERVKKERQPREKVEHVSSSTLLSDSVHEEGSKAEL